ncbi:MAG: restriction endonuclease subunit S [Brachymonas denitrificans]
MELMPGYKRSDVGVIPDDWDAKPLGEIGDSLIGLTYRPSEVRKYGTLVLRSSNVQNGTLCFDDNVFVDADIPDRIMVRPGDILVCVRNGSRDLIGKSALIDERAVGMTFGAFMGVFRSEYGQFLRHVFQSGIFKKQINEHLGATINQITNKSLNSFKVPLPPTDEERTEIACALSDVDALLASLDQVIAKKRNLKQAAMQKLLTGETRLPGFSGEWETLPAREIGFFKGGSGFPLGAQGEPNGEYPFFKVSDMNNEGNETFMTVANHYISEQTRTRLGATAFPPDSIVFAKVGAAVFLERKRILGQASCIDNNMAAFVLDKSRVDVGYVHALLLNKKLSALVTTTALPALNAKQLGEMPLAVPPLPEQSAIATVLSDMDAELSVLEARRDKTRNIKQAMMQELLTGKTRLV